MKPVVFLVDALKKLKSFPEAVRVDAGRELRRVQEGDEPIDWKPMPDVGRGVREIRIAERSGAYRVIMSLQLVIAFMFYMPFKRSRRKPRSLI